MNELDVISNVEAPCPSSDDKEKEKSLIMKSVISLSLAMTFLFTSYFSLENVQSSINKVDGTTSLAAVYTSFIISSCLLSTFLLRTLKEKYTLFVCCLSYVAYMAVQLHPRLYLLIPAAVLLGLAAGPLWAAQGTYITKIGTKYARLTREDPNVVITRFFSIFFLFFQSTQIWGNLISSSVLSVGAITPRDEESMLSCGYRFCMNKNDVADMDPPKNSSDPAGPPPWQLHALTASYISGALLSAATIYFVVDPLHDSQECHDNNGVRKKMNIMQMFTATFNHMRHPYQLLLMPLTVWSGIERAFIGADFTAAYVSCGLGVHMVGYTMICYGVCDVIGSMVASRLVQAMGRISVITLAFLINISVIVAMILWLPRSGYIFIYFIMAGLWGLADAIWMTQMNSLYGTLFQGESEPAFSNCRLWEATGFSLSFGLSSAVCISAKIVVVLVFLVVGVIGYYYVEVLEKMGGLPRDNKGKVIPLDRLHKSI